MMYHVCIVEDDRNMLNIIRLVMEASGFRTSCFGTFEEAREHVGSDYDVWLLDIMLKKESGLELFKIVKQMKPDMPIIFISARDKGSTASLDWNWEATITSPSHFLRRNWS